MAESSKSSKSSMRAKSYEEPSEGIPVRVSAGVPALGPEGEGQPNLRLKRVLEVAESIVRKFVARQRPSVSGAVADSAVDPTLAYLLISIFPNLVTLLVRANSSSPPTNTIITINPPLPSPPPPPPSPPPPLPPPPPTDTSAGTSTTISTTTGTPPPPPPPTNTTTSTIHTTSTDSTIRTNSTTNTSSTDIPMDTVITEWDRDIEKRVMRMIRALLPLAIHFVNNHPSGAHQVQPFPVFGDLSSLSSSSSTASELYDVVHQKLHNLLEWQREQKVGDEVLKDRDDLLAAMRSAQWVTPVMVDDVAAAAHVVPSPDIQLSDRYREQLCIRLAIVLPCLFLISLLIVGLRYALKESDQ